MARISPNIKTFSVAAMACGFTGAFMGAADPTVSVGVATAFVVGGVMSDHIFDNTKNLSLSITTLAILDTSTSIADSGLVFAGTAMVCGYLAKNVSKGYLNRKPALLGSVFGLAGGAALAMGAAHFGLVGNDMSDEEKQPSILHLEGNCPETVSFVKTEPGQYQMDTPNCMLVSPAL